MGLSPAVLHLIPVNHDVSDIDGLGAIATGTPNRVLFLDASGNLAVDDDFVYTQSTGTFRVNQSISGTVDAAIFKNTTAANSRVLTLHNCGNSGFHLAFAGSLGQTGDSASILFDRADDGGLADSEQPSDIGGTRSIGTLLWRAHVSGSYLQVASDLTQSDGTAAGTRRIFNMGTIDRYQFNDTGLSIGSAAVVEAYTLETYANLGASARVANLTSSTQTGIHDTLILLARSATAGLSTGYGARLVFRNEYNSGSNGNDMGSLSVTHDSGANNGALSVRLNISGTQTERLNISSAGIANFIGRLGVNASGTTRIFECIRTASLTNAKFNFQTVTTNAAVSVLDLMAQSTGSSSDGFGPALDLYHRDNTNSDSLVSRIFANRNGADNTARLELHTATSGTLRRMLMFDQTTFTFGNGQAGVDYILTFNGETNDGSLTWMEDENWFLFNDTVTCSPATELANLRVVGLLDNDSWIYFKSGDATNPWSVGQQGTAETFVISRASDVNSINALQISASTGTVTVPNRLAISGTGTDFGWAGGAALSAVAVDADYAASFSGNVGINHSTNPLYSLVVGQNSAGTVGMNRHTSGATVGQNLTVRAGAPRSGETNLNGGTLTLMSGVSTGNGGSQIVLQVVATNQGTGTTDRNPTTLVTCSKPSGVGLVSIAGDLQCTDGTNQFLRLATSTSTVATLQVGTGSSTVFGTLALGTASTSTTTTILQATDSSGSTQFTRAIQGAMFTTNTSADKYAIEFNILNAGTGNVAYNTYGVHATATDVSTASNTQTVNAYGGNFQATLAGFGSNLTGGGDNFAYGLRAIATSSAGGSTTDAIYLYSVYGRAPSVGSAGTVVSWAGYFESDVQLSSGAKLILEGSATSKGDSYLDYSSGVRVFESNTLAMTFTSTSVSTALLLNASTSGIKTKQSVANVSSPPTDAELDSAFGTPATLGRGFIGTIDDNDGDATVWICVTSDASWYMVATTKAV